MTRISTPKHAREPTQETEGQESLETYHRGRHTQEYETDYAGQGLLPERLSPLHMSCQDRISGAQSEDEALVGLRAHEAASFAFKEAGQEREVETIHVAPCRPLPPSLACLPPAQQFTEQILARPTRLDRILPVLN
jgi:hypothetical protein